MNHLDQKAYSYGVGVWSLIHKTPTLGDISRMLANTSLAEAIAGETLSNELSSKVLDIYGYDAFRNALETSDTKNRRDTAIYNAIFEEYLNSTAVYKRFLQRLLEEQFEEFLLEDARWEEHLQNLFDREPADPFVIDLDGDGVELTGLDGSGAFFDLDGDGFAERTGWVSSDDGLLALDRGGQAQWGSCIDPLGAPNALQLSQGTLVVLADLMRGHDWIGSHDADATRGCLIS